jgi:RNA polymerase sigma-70 factor (ECF subfamily)
LSDQQSIEEVAKLWTEMTPAVATFIRSMVSRMHDAQDLLQDVAVEVVRQYPGRAKNKPIRGWVMGIARNKVKEYYRNSAVRSRVLSDAAIELVAVAVAEKDDYSYEVAAALQKCIDRLDPRTRSLLNLRYEDLSCSQVAQRTSATIGAVKVALYRLRASLLRCVERRLDPAGGTQ